MKAVGIRELRNKLSEYLRMVRRGEEILVTDRGTVVAAIRQPGSAQPDTPYPALLTAAAEGAVHLGHANRADLYPDLEPLPAEGEVARLLDEERGER